MSYRMEMRKDGRPREVGSDKAHLFIFPRFISFHVIIFSKNMTILSLPTGFALLIGLATFYRVGPYTQLSWSCYVQIAACLFATAAAALLLWDAMRLSEECLPREVIVVRHAMPLRHRRRCQNEYVETPC